MAKQLVLLPESLFGSAWSFLPPGMLEDLLALAKVAADRLDQLAVDLGQQPGILNGRQLEEIVRRHVEEPSLAQSVMNTLVNLRSDRLDDTIRTVQRWREANPQNAAKVPAETVEAIRDRLGRLIRDFAALVRYRKAQRLMSLTGRSAQSIELICDLRAVFDHSRTVVEGLIPMTTLRVEYTHDETNGSLEVLLTPDDLERLAGEVERARTKLRSLNQHVEGWLPGGLVEPD